ncbi:DNA-directed RNA polymerase [Salix suchowensis]|nr:DNA-directed RNA polymerase [Salix suchowensis]
MEKKKSGEFKELEELVWHHIDSFDYMVDRGLEIMLDNIKPVRIYDPHTDTSLSHILLQFFVVVILVIFLTNILLYMSNPRINAPIKDIRSRTNRKRLLPFECRQAKVSYTGKFEADVCFQYDGRPVIREKYNLGQFPIMLKSKLCYLRSADPQQLVSLKEEASEVGGYFILNGIERVFRCLIMPKQNYPMSMTRGSYRERREGYTDKAVVIRCVREYQSSLTDHSSVTVRLYYLRNGSAELDFGKPHQCLVRGREYLLPVGIVLKALVETTDREIYENLTCYYDEKYEKVKGAVGSQLLGERAKIILDEVRVASLFTQDDCLQHIGEHFQPVVDELENKTPYTVAHAVLKDYVFVHLPNFHDKFSLLIFMLQKLFSFVDQTSALDNPDSLQNQDILLPGHLITIYLKEKLEDWLRKAKSLIQDELAKNNTFNFLAVGDVRKVMDKNSSVSISTAVESMLRSGRLATQTGLDLQQRAGYTVQAERLNYLRFLSFFRAVHRGASFAGGRTTSVRKLLPESWGFLCPVHTPDGEPCGLLNHMTCSCRVTSYFDSQGAVKDFFDIRKSILGVLTSLGMIASLPKLVHAGPPKSLSVLLDGRVIGSLPSSKIEKVVAHLRRLKVSATSAIPDDMEVGYVPLSIGGAYPGLYISTYPSRFIRPVRNISIPCDEGQDIELIGPFEQVFMEIKCPDGGNGGRSDAFPATHEEIHPTNMISVVANLTPWSDHNQSPRNMYQCQMAKQTMAFSLQSLCFRADQKIYHLQLVTVNDMMFFLLAYGVVMEILLVYADTSNSHCTTGAYTKYSIDEHPTGTNAIVAVLAYTGYDMEDAMILNKSSVDRGMFHGQIYQGSKSDRSHRRFRRSNTDRSSHSLIDSDGLPYVGQIIQPNEPYCSIYNDITNSSKAKYRKGSEPAIVDYVAVDTKSKNHLQKVNIRFRHPRNPIIGDKFSNIDMPFSGVTGMRPDLIINPHAFPSRMTIAMLLESLAAKGGSLNGNFVDATPFASTVRAANAGEATQNLNHLLMNLARYFYGPVYYQRLRHMVSDKFQVRSTGPVDQITRQPIKGRKRGGGIRFGEMERDSMLAHGAAYLLHDRLHTCSDYHIADVCSICGSILTTHFQPQRRIVRDIGGLPPVKAPKKVVCHACQTSKGIETVAMPYVFRYLAAELAAMNIKMTLHLNDGA